MYDTSLFLLLCFQSDPYWTVDTLTARERSRIGNQTVCSLVEMLRLVSRSNSSALLNIHKPPPEHPRSRNWFMDTLWAVQKAGISQKRVRTVGPLRNNSLIIDIEDYILSTTSMLHSV